jgi:competence protein ComEC
MCTLAPGKTPSDPVATGLRPTRHPAEVTGDRPNKRCRTETFFRGGRLLVTGERQMLVVHVLNVGKGSCAILDFQDSHHLSMLDIDNSSDLTDPLAFFQAQYPGRRLFRFILSHPDLDHMSGLNALAAAVKIDNLWDTDNNKSLSDTDWEYSPYNREDWDAYQHLRRSTDNTKCIRPHQGDTASCCWVEDGITIIAPTEHLDGLANDTNDHNHQSYVLLIEHHGIRILFGGDASREAWEEIKRTWGIDRLRADIFVAPHHGSERNIHEEVFAHIHPEYVIVSVADGQDYAYDYYNRLAKERVLSTKHYGTMKITIPGNGVPYAISVEKGVP